VISPSPTGVLVFEHEPGYGAGLWHNVFATIWRDAPALEQLQRLEAHQQEAARRCPAGFVAIAVLPSQHTNMSHELREAAEHLSTHPSPALVAIAEVITGTGFVAATTRMIATGMALLNRRTPVKLFASLEEAARWVSQRAGAVPGAAAFTPSELIAALAELG
jgi:hypothetical protein